MKVEDIKAYIETGILELYVLGNVSPEEKLQVEEMAAKYPEIRAEITAIEQSLENFALQNAIEPPDHLREKVLNSLVTNFAGDTNFPSKQITHADDDVAAKHPATESNNVVSFTSPATPKQNNFYKYAFAASLLALIACAFSIVSLNRQLEQSATVIASLQQKNQSFASRVNLLNNAVYAYHDPQIKMVKLQGMPKAPGAKLTLAWSPQNKKVMIDMQDMKLAANDQAHQYQLWAIVNGKPVDLGVFDAKTDSVGMKEMKPVANAVMFAVTLEPRGGSVNPTMDQMVLAAKI